MPLLHDSILRTALVTGLVGALCAAGARAQDPPPVDRDLPPLSGFSVVPFFFDPPGSRSLGMGGTFTALADDATAAEANPAGLTKLSRPEVSIHGRHTSYDIETLDINAVTSLDLLNRARNLRGDVRPGTTIGNAFATGTRVRYDPEVTEASFASYVKPMGDYTFSVYYQRSADFRGEDRFEAFDDSRLDFYRARQELDFLLDTVGVSAAFKAGDMLSIGFSVRFSELSVEAFQDLTIEYRSDAEFAALDAGASLADVRALGIVDEQVLRQTFDDTDTDITFNVGLLFNPEGRFSVGLVYKDGGSFEIIGDSQDFGCVEVDAAPDFRCPPGGDMRTAVNYKVPDFLGLGFAWRLSDRFRLAADANWISFSDLDIAPAPNPNQGPGVAGQFETIDDEIALHFGLEYIAFLGTTPLTLRAGVYTDPDRDGITSIDSDETNYTFGIGTVLMESFQIDLAAQTSDRAQSGILS
ncbi:MAG: outer membrane protein transport protein, partial [Acidobacteriota bacterium]